jgi:broad specificity phosphatase PhoE
MKNEQDFIILQENQGKPSLPLILLICLIMFLVFLILAFFALKSKLEATSKMQEEQKIPQVATPPVSSSTTNNSLSLFDLLPKETKINLLPIANCPIRPNDTTTLKTISSCCSAIVKQKLQLSSSSSSANISSSLILMRHFERLDHVEANWYSRFNQEIYFPHDAPLSPRGVQDGLNFTSELSSRLAKKSRSEDNFSFTVSSPSLRCVQTSILVALETKTAIVIEESLSDWMNRKVFGSNLKEKPEISLKKSQQQHVMMWWIPGEIIRSFFAIVNKISNNISEQRKIEDLAKCGVVYDKEKDQFGFFDFSNLVLISEKNNTTRKTTIFKNFPETEKDFSERVQEAIETLTQQNRWKMKIDSKAASSGGVQKVFSPSQIQKEFFFSTETRNKSALNHYRLYGLRLFVVTHADFVRVAATDLCPRCSCTPAAKDGISVVYGSLTQIVKLIPWKALKQNEQEDDDDDASLHCYHLVCFGSRTSSSLDCPTIG